MKPVHPVRSTLVLGLFVAVTAGAAAVGSQFLPGAWYASLAKPFWTPPNWLFAPVWSVIYLMIAVAGWLAWRASRGKGRSMYPVLGMWTTALALNGAWSWIMFGRHAIGAALVDISALWLSIVAFAWLARPLSRPAALLFAPYLAWVSYATALNAAIWRLNP